MTALLHRTMDLDVSAGSVDRAMRALGRLWWCLAHDEPWNENTAWPTPETTAELIAA